MKQIALFAIPYCVFSFIAKFTDIQSLILTILTVAVLNGLSSTTKQKQAFKPSYIHIDFKWYEILREEAIGLSAMLRWKALMEDERAGEYSVLHDGITLTALSPTLWYSQDRRQLLSQST